MPIFRVWQFKLFYQVPVVCNETIGYCFIDCTPQSLNSLWIKIRPIHEQMMRPFVVYLVRPTRFDRSFHSEPDTKIANTRIVEDVGIVNRSYDCIVQSYNPISSLSLVISRMACVERSYCCCLYAITSRNRTRR